MEKVIVGFSNICAGWMNMEIYDCIQKEIRKTRISYIQDFFDDLVMLCRFISSDLTGSYVLDIDQEGFDSYIKVNKFDIGKGSKISIELSIGKFEDEIEYPNLNDKEDYTPTELYYIGLDAEAFIWNIVNLIRKNKKEYNEGFVLSESNKFNEKMFARLKKETKKRFERRWRY